MQTAIGAVQVIREWSAASDTVRYARIAPAVITHIGAMLGGLAGLITAGQMAHACGRPPHVSACRSR